MDFFRKINWFVILLFVNLVFIMIGIFLKYSEDNRYSDLIKSQQDTIAVLHTRDIHFVEISKILEINQQILLNNKKIIENQKTIIGSMDKKMDVLVKQHQEILNVIKRACK